MARPLSALLCLSALGLAAPASAGKRSTCFDGPPLVAGNVWYHLRHFSASQDFWDGESPLPEGRYGRCAVKGGMLFDPRGRRLAKLHCGIEVERRGLIDHLGLEVGALGKQVIERTRPENEELVCTGYTGGSRCYYHSDRGHEPPARYIVGRTLAGGAVLRGKAAERFFRDQRIKTIFVTMSCH